MKFLKRVDKVKCRGISDLKLNKLGILFSDVCGIMVIKLDLRVLCCLCKIVLDVNECKKF